MAKERKSRRAYLNDFQQDESGQYQYKGEVYLLENKEPEQVSKKLLTFVTGSLGSCVVAGFIPYDGMSGSPMVVFPYLVEFGFSILLAVAVYTFTKNIRELRSYQYNKSIEKVKPYGMIVIIGIVAGLLASVSRMFGQKEGVQTIYALFFIALKCVNFFMIKNTTQLVGQLSFKKKKTG